MLRVEPELVGLPGKALTLDATRRLLFVVHTAGGIHSMMLMKKMQCCNIHNIKKNNGSVSKTLLSNKA